jgi:hypothetical protein
VQQWMTRSTRSRARNSDKTRTFVVTCRVPYSHLAELDVTQRDHTIDVQGPGFRRELALPEEADMEHLEVELHKHFLEIRAPLK